MSSFDAMIAIIVVAYALRYGWHRWCESRVAIEKERTEQARIAAKASKEKP